MNNYDLYHSSWTPPYCPSPKCKHHGGLREGWKFKRMGSFFRKAEPHRIRRFQCLVCGVTFSSQTFSATYWLKRPDILPKLMTKTVGCMCNRQIADDLKVSPPTIDRQLNRLGRHCLLFHAMMTKDMAPPREVVIDGFESFELSQYHPFHLHLAADKATSFFLWFTDSELRRKGQMTARQKEVRAQKEMIFGRPDPQAVRKDMGELLEVVASRAGEIIIYSDAHKSYPLAMRGLTCRIRHVVTSSKAYRDCLNRMFEINLLDLLVRHGSGNHKRETIAYSKRRQCAAMRLAIFLVWRNYVRLRRVRRCSESPAMLLGLCSSRLTVDEVLSRRLFVYLVDLQGRWREYYWSAVETRGLKVNRRHDLKRAV